MNPFITPARGDSVEAFTNYDPDIFTAHTPSSCLLGYAAQMGVGYGLYTASKEPLSVFIAYLWA